MSSYQVRLAPRAARELRKLPANVRRRVERSLIKLAAEVGAKPRGGRGVKALRGREDSFYRLRVGDYRVMFDRIDDARTLLVLGIVHRRDLERWLRG